MVRVLWPSPTVGLGLVESGGATYSPFFRTAIGYPILTLHTVSDFGTDFQLGKMGKLD